MVSVELRCIGEDRGNYYDSSGRAIIYLNQHESLDDLYKTIQHELIHHAIKQCGEEIDEDQEERVIFAIAWAEESII